MKGRTSYIKVISILALVVFILITGFYVFLINKFGDMTEDAVNEISKQVVKWDQDSISVIDTIYNALENAKSNINLNNLETED